MWPYVLLTLRRRRNQSMLTSGGFLLAACALILLSATTQTTALQATHIIHQNWRPAYDLVVLPPDAQTPGGTTIPADSLEGYNGGISLQQYAQVQAIPGVEVAAPLAFLGYIQLPSPALQFTSTPLSPGYYQVDWTLTAFNGLRRVVERQVSFIYGMFSSCDYAQWKELYPDLDQQHVLFGSCGPDIVSDPSYFTIFSIDTGSFLLAAIDPVAENQLLHLDRGIVRGRMLEPQDGITDIRLPVAGLRHQLPLLFHQQLPGQIALHATIRQLTTTQLNPRVLEQRGGFSYLAHLPGQRLLLSQNVPIVQNDPQRFADANLVWTGKEWQLVKYPNVGTGLRLLYTPSGLRYQPVTGPDGQPTYALVPSSTQSAKAPLSALPDYYAYEPDAWPDDQQGPEVMFRTLSPLLSRDPSYHNFNYLAQPVGEFQGTAINAQLSNALNWLPETTYAAPPVVLRYDAQGHPVAPTPLLPTTNPAGMLLQPPLALTTLKAATQLLGDHAISVIRVRVSGVNAPDDASWKRVERVAQLIQQRTGLEALVTLGSSPAPTLVYVPGLTPGQDGSTRTIAPLGWVEERWIALGVSLVYLGEVSQFRLLLLGTLLLVCLGYLMVSLTALVASQRRDLAILSALGWPPWQPTRLFLTQALLFALGGGLGGMGLALLLVVVLGADPPWLVVALTLPAMLVLALLSSLAPLWQLWRIHPAEVLRAGSTITRERERPRRLPRWLSWLAGRWPALGGMAMRNLRRARLRTLIALGSLFLSAVLLTVMVQSLLTFQQQLHGTLLGAYILLQTAVPQVAGTLFAVLLTFLSVADLLLLQVRERQKEIGLLQAVGWRTRVVQRLFVQEGVSLAVVGAVPGVLVAVGVLLARHQIAGGLPVPLVGVGAVLVLLVVTGLAALPAIRAINRLPMSEVLRGE